MIHRLKKGEPLADGLKRIVRDEIGSSANHLGGKTQVGRDEAIHEARKSIKRVRAILKLTRNGLGRVYFTENARLRDVARTLSGFRDAAAMVETFDDLKHRYAEDIGRRRLASVRAALSGQKRQSAAEDIGRPLREAESVLRQVWSDVEAWPLRANDFAGIRKGLKETYRRGRNALARAEKSPQPVNYHELRKRVKDLWHQIRLIRSVWTGIEKSLESDLKQLESWLGDDHNLVLLRAAVESDSSSYGSTKDVDLVLTLADKYQKKLRDDALRSAAGLYKDKPRDYIDRLKRLCHESPAKSGRASTAS